MSRYLLLLLPVVWSGLVQASNFTKVPIYKFYPQCDYQIIDEITVKQKLNFPKGQTPKEAYAEAFDVIKVEVLQRASEAKADGVIFTKRVIQLIGKNLGPSIIKPYKAVEYTVELIKDCQPDPVVPKRPVPIGPNGAIQKALGLSTKSQQNVISLEITLPLNQKRKSPELKSNLISFSRGVYGVSLGSDFQSVSEAFGTPTFVMQVDAKHQLVAYGRRHWFIFVENSLEFVSTNSPWFSHEFINFLVFDERFDDLQWTIEGKITQGEKPTEVLNSSSYSSKDNNKIVLRAANQEILVDIEQYKNEVNTKVAGFTLMRQGFDLPKLVDFDNSTAVLKEANTYFVDPSREPLNLEKLGIRPIATAWLDSTSQLLVFGRHLLAEKRGSRISKFHFIENVFDLNVTDSQKKWQFNGLHQGDSLEKVLESVGEDAFQLGDMVEVTGDKYSQNLYFYMQNDILRLLTSEMYVY